MSDNKTPSQLAKEAQKREAERKSVNSKIFEIVRNWLAAFGIFVFLIIVSAITAYFILPNATDAPLPWFQVIIRTLVDSMPKNIITIVLMLGVFLFALCGFFADKKEGYGPFNTSTLLIILALMVSVVVFLVDQTKKEDITKIIFAVIGFAGGLFASKDKDKE